MLTLKKPKNVGKRQGPQCEGAPDEISGGTWLRTIVFSLQQGEQMKSAVKVSVQGRTVSGL